MTNTYNWGILATGNIAESMAYSLKECERAELVAVGSRTQASADAFGEKWKVPHRHGSYADLAADPDVDIIYIATPHSAHYDNMKLCLNAGKHVLCEKPLTLNAAQARECIELAREKGLFLMEAVWMRFLPAVGQVREWIDADKVGDIRLLVADFCIHIPFESNHRLFDPALGGGALLDLGIYPLSLATLLLGFPDQVSGRALDGQTGVDETNAVTLYYDRGALARLSSSTRTYIPGNAYVAGHKGTITIHDPFYHPQRVTLVEHGHHPKTVEKPYRANGYIHEVEAVHESLDTGQIEHPLMPHQETLQMMTLMDQLRERWGVEYPIN